MKLVCTEYGDFSVECTGWFWKQKYKFAMYIILHTDVLNVIVVHLDTTPMALNCRLICEDWLQNWLFTGGKNLGFRFAVFMHKLFLVRHTEQQCALFEIRTSCIHWHIIHIFTFAIKWTCYKFRISLNIYIQNSYWWSLHNLTWHSNNIAFLPTEY